MLQRSGKAVATKLQILRSGSEGVILVAAALAANAHNHVVGM
jgi:hypothetical protein